MKMIEVFFCYQNKTGHSWIQKSLLEYKEVAPLAGLSTKMHVLVEIVKKTPQHATNQPTKKKPKPQTGI